MADADKRREPRIVALVIARLDDRGPLLHDAVSAEADAVLPELGELHARLRQPPLPRAWTHVLSPFSASATTSRSASASHFTKRFPFMPLRASATRRVSAIVK